MTLQEIIKDDTIKSMKAKTSELTMILRLVTSEITRNEKIVTDDEAIKVIKKMAGNAKDLGNISEQLILEKYLPQMLSEDHIRVIVQGTIEARGFSGMQDMGKVMGALKSHPDITRIDGKISSKIVKEILAK